MRVAGMTERWEPHDRSALEQIRRFELDQPHATAGLLGTHVAALQMAQTILLNVTARVLQLSKVVDEDSGARRTPHLLRVERPADGDRDRWGRATRSSDPRR